MPRRRAPIASLVAVVTLAMAFVVAAFSLPIDDFWLSIASGEAIMRGADLSLAIDFNWLPILPDALNPQWGAQLLLGAHGSLAIALALNAILIIIALVITLVRVASRASAEATAVAMLLVLAALAPHLLARAQSFSLAFFVGGLLILDRGRDHAWTPMAFGLLVALWANLHGAFVVGVLAAFAYAVGTAFDQRRISLTYGAATLLAVAAVLANPVGIDLFAYALNQPASDVVRSISVEWQPAWPWIPVATPFWVLLAIVVAGRVMRPRSASATELILLTGLGALGISGIRHLPWFILAAAPLIAADVEAALRRLPRLRQALGAVRPGLSAALPTAIVMLALVAISIQLLRPAMPRGLARLTPDEPVTLVDRLADEIRDESCCVRILNEQVWGGYLLYRLADRIEVAMDGRLEIRSRDTWSEYFDMMHGTEGVAERLARDNVSWAIVHVDREALLTRLSSAGWTELERSAQGVLLRAPASSAHEAGDSTS